MISTIPSSCCWPADTVDSIRPIKQMSLGKESIRNEFEMMDVYSYILSILLDINLKGRDIGPQQRVSRGVKCSDVCKGDSREIATGFP